MRDLIATSSPGNSRGSSVVRGPTRTQAVRTARGFLRAGFSIIPLWPRAKSPANPGGCNKPISRWIEFLQYERRWPDLNFGIVTGAINELAVIDVDGEEGGEFLRNLETKHDRLPPTVVVQTAKGKHLYFASGNTELRCRTKWGPQLDLRANGGYIVGPNSIHESGVRYHYAEGCSPKDVDFAPLPPWLETILLSKQSLQEPSAPSTISTGAVIEGHRNDYLTSIAGHLRNSGLHADALVAALIAENKIKCSPPLADEEVLAVAASISRYAAHQSSKDEAERVMDCVLADHFDGGTNLLKCADGKFWSFDKTHWTPLSVGQCKKKILKTIQAMPERSSTSTSALMNQVDSLLGARCAEAGDPLRFQSDPPLVLNCRNCEVWLNERGEAEQRPHRATSYLRHCFNVEYHPDAQCARYDQAVLEIFGRSAEPEGLALLWDEILGYAMQGRRPRPHIIVGRGSGSNGKTALVQLFLKLLGPEAVQALPIEDLEKNRFAIGGLNGKLLLLDDDVKAGTRLPDGPLKKVSEAKIITGELKFGPSFNFTVRTLPIMLTNNQLSVADLSHGLRRRMLVIPFERQFSDKAADVNLFENIAAHEMSGVFNRYLRGLQRVRSANWSFAVPEAVRDATAKFLEEANPLPSFIEEKCEKKGRQLVSELFAHYTDWCEASGIGYRQQRMHFGRNLQNLGYTIDHCSAGDRVHGLRFRVSS